MHSLRRFVIAPLVTIGTIAGVEWLDRHFSIVQYPAAVVFLAVVLSTYIGGVVPGLVSAAIAVAWAVLFFSEPGQLLHLRLENLTRIALLVAATLMVGLLYVREKAVSARERQSRERIEAANCELLGLRAGLDQVEFGVVLLDADLRVQFINRASLRIWQLSEEQAEGRPEFGDLMRHGCGAGTYAIPPGKFDAYVAERVALVRLGDETPRDLRLADGRVIRFQCTVLPEGGRMLSYTEVTDLVNHADQLSRLTTIDALTGIYNRRHFLMQAESEWKRYQRHHRPLSLLMVDIDLIKSINNHFGRCVGDQVISRLAGLCKDGKRGSDIVARVGGDEFALLLPETDLGQACILAERLRQKVIDRPLVLNETSIATTVTIGVARADLDMFGIPALMKRAEHALEEAKRAGRNRIARAAVAPEHDADAPARPSSKAG